MIQVTKEYYTYKVCYEDGTPFYIGKGKDNRAYKHLKIRDEHTVTMNRIITDILANEQKILVKIVQYFPSEKEALLNERDLIRYYSSSGLLVNIIHNKIRHNTKAHKFQLNKRYLFPVTCQQKWNNEDDGSTQSIWSMSIEEERICNLITSNALNIIIFEQNTIRFILKHMGIYEECFFKETGISKDKAYNNDFTEQDIKGIRYWLFLKGYEYDYNGNMKYKKIPCKFVDIIYKW